MERGERDGDQELQADGLRRLGEIVDNGTGAEEAWEHFNKVAELRGRMSDRERRRIRDAYQMMTTNDGLLLVDQFFQAVSPFIKEPDALRGAAEAIGRIFSGQPRQ